MSNVTFSTPVRNEIWEFIGECPGLPQITCDEMLAVYHHIAALQMLLDDFCGDVLNDDLREFVESELGKSVLCESVIYRLSFLDEKVYEFTAEMVVYRSDEYPLFSLSGFEVDPVRAKVKGVFRFDRHEGMWDIDESYEVVVVR